MASTNPLAGALPSDITFGAHGSTAQGLGHTLVVAVVLMPCAYCAGLGARSFLKLPAITAYLATGIVCGPYVLGMLSAQGVASLSVIEGACLGVIGLAAGAELHLSDLARSRRAVAALTVAICGATWVGVFLVLLWAAPVSPAAIAAAYSRGAQMAGAGGAAGGGRGGMSSGGGTGFRALLEEAALAAAAGGGRSAKAVAHSTAGAAAVARAASSAVSPHFEEVAHRLRPAVASLGATLMMARSPASAVGLRLHSMAGGAACMTTHPAATTKQPHPLHPPAPPTPPTTSPHPPTRSRSSGRSAARAPSRPSPSASPS
jgi:hypothetical protein